MNLYSTKSPLSFVSLKEAVLKGLPEDNGLYMPESISSLSPSFFSSISSKSFAEISFLVAQHLLDGAVPNNELSRIIEIAINFPAPLVQLDSNRNVLELFHGPSLAFKDFGARFMAGLMSYFNRNEDKNLTILVATSGDTGGAVASGFYKVKGINVIILYPSQKVSFLQEKQLTTLGHNITALEIKGTFDDCQAIVKKAFLDSELNKQFRLSSANSINIARLIPQSFYYFEAFKQFKNKSLPVVFSVPSGNFGNLTAGLLAKKMGLPIYHFIAATNINDVVPQYLNTGKFKARPSTQTISNAMDVGNPSNFARMLDLKQSSWKEMKAAISGYAFSDSETELAMKSAFEKYQYTFDPHGAVGYLALNEYLKKNPNAQGIVLETAHPSKFVDDVERVLGHQIEIPKSLSNLADKKKEAVLLNNSYTSFKDWILSNSI